MNVSCMNIGRGQDSLNITNNNLLIRFNKTREIFPSVARVLSILLTTAATTANVERRNSKEGIHGLMVGDLRQETKCSKANSALQLVRIDFWIMMGEEDLNFFAIEVPIIQKPVQSYIEFGIFSLKIFVLLQVHVLFYKELGSGLSPDSCLCFQGFRASRLLDCCLLY